MADSKKYDGSQWEHSLRKLTTATEAVENPLYSDGTAITAYTIKGNTIQNGTPTPSNPVEVNGVGVRTENLFDVSSWAASVTGVRGNGSLSVSGNTISVTSNELQDAYTVPYTNVTGVYKIPVKPSTQYRIQGALSSSGSMIIFQNGATASWTAFGVVTTAADTTFLTIRFGVKSSEPLGTTATFENFMISEGASEKNYEPYGYKIPISSGGVTTNIYLGSTQTIRQVKKYEFTGDESIDVLRMQTSGFFYYKIFEIIQNNNGYALSTHYQTAQVINVDMPDKSIKQTTTTAVFNTGAAIVIKDTQYTTIEDFKAYLAAQYVAGTPVSVWYCLTTEETDTINEPLMRLVGGNGVAYADTLSNATAIPTTEGANSITVDTTVQPSEFTATWTGWHDGSVQEYVGGVGLNKFDEQYPDIKFDVIYRPLYVGSGEFTCTSTCPQSQYGAQLFILAGNVSSGASTNTNGVWNGTVRSVTAVDGYVTIVYRNAGGVSPSDYDTMLNAGSTALPYEPYEYGWE